MLEESTAYDWWQAPDEAPDFGDLPDAGRVLEVCGKDDRRASRLQKQALAAGLREIGYPKRALALDRCCTTWVVHRFERGRKVVGVTECGDLLCPDAMRKRSRRLTGSVCDSIEGFCAQRPGLQGLMVTLTVRNCPSHELQATVGRVIRAYGELMQRVAVKRACHAWVRSVELTRNAQTREWHVHVHAVWFVERAAYFKGCNLVFTRKGSFIVQPRNPPGSHGYVFEGCTVAALNPGFDGALFARDFGTPFPNGEAVFLNTAIKGDIMAALPWSFSVTHAKAARGTLVAMVGMRASCQPMPVLMRVAPAASTAWASSTTSSNEEPPSTRSSMDRR